MFLTAAAVLGIIFTLEKMSSKSRIVKSFHLKKFEEGRNSTAGEQFCHNWGNNSVEVITCTQTLADLLLSLHFAKKIALLLSIFNPSLDTFLQFRKSAVLHSGTDDLAVSKVKSCTVPSTEGRKSRTMMK